MTIILSRNIFSLFLSHLQTKNLHLARISKSKFEETIHHFYVLRSIVPTYMNRHWNELKFQSRGHPYYDVTPS